MKKLVLASLGAFWVAVLALVASGLHLRPEGVGVDGGRAWTREEVRSHDSLADCWMIIDRDVYDVTSYVHQHPAPAEVLRPWCGREATRGYADKGGRGRSHSDFADELLATFRIGRLAE